MNEIIRVGERKKMKDKTIFNTFQINKRDKPLSNILQKFWSDIKANVEELTNKYCEDINEDILTETMNFAYILKGSVK